LKVGGEERLVVFFKEGFDLCRVKVDVVQRFMVVSNDLSELVCAQVER